MLRYLVVAILASFTVPGSAAGPAESPVPLSLKGVEAQVREAREAVLANPCLQNRGLDRTGFRFTLDGRGGDRLDLGFVFDACYVTDRDHDSDPITPIATRMYVSRKTGYKLSVRVESGSEEADVMLHQYQSEAAFLNSASLGSHRVDRLLLGPLALGQVSVSDFRWHYAELKGKGVLSPGSGEETLSTLKVGACWTRPADAELDAAKLPVRFCIDELAMLPTPHWDRKNGVLVRGEGVSGRYPLHIVGRSDRGYRVKAVLFEMHQREGGCSDARNSSIVAEFDLDLSAAIGPAQPEIESWHTHTADECHDDGDSRRVDYRRGR